MRCFDDMGTVSIANTNLTTGERTHEVEIPVFGLGVYLMKEPGECKSSVLHALEKGYRLIDTAMAYGNEHEVGEAISDGNSSRRVVRCHQTKAATRKQPRRDPREVPAEP